MILLLLLGFALVAAAASLVWCATSRWWHPLIIAVLWMPLFPLAAQWLTGDVSRYLPPGLFSDGMQGKDEIIVASALSTIIVAIAGAALLFWAARIGWERLRA